LINYGRKRFITLGPSVIDMAIPSIVKKAQQQTHHQSKSDIASFFSSPFMIGQGILTEGEGSVQLTSSIGSLFCKKVK
jgi:hypothetical protein